MVVTFMKKLRRTKGEERKVMGVCGGLGKCFGIDPTFIRLAFALVCIFPPVGTITTILIYLVMGFVIPEENDYIDV